MSLLVISINTFTKEQATNEIKILTAKQELQQVAYSTIPNRVVLLDNVYFPTNTTTNDKKIETLSLNTYQGQWEIGQEIELPDLPTNVKFYTDYRSYGIPGTPHNRIQKLSYTDDLGCRRYNDDYCVALGSYYSSNIGDRFEVTLESGNVFTVILSDSKADCHTDGSNRYTPCTNYDGEACASVLEFIIDSNVASKKMCSYGSLDYYDLFKGNISQMVYLGRDDTYDWDLYE